MGLRGWRSRKIKIMARQTNQIKTTWRDKEKSVQSDQVSLYTQTEELVLQALYSCIVRDVMKEYQYQRAEAFRKYNVVATFSHVALANYALQQLWKLFDQENSTMHVWYVVKHMPYLDLKTWFDLRIKELEPDIKYLSAWRHNAVGHRSAIGHFAPREFEKKFEGEQVNEERIRLFLLDFLCEMRFQMYRTSKEEQKQIFREILTDYQKLVENDRDEILQKYGN